MGRTGTTTIARIFADSFRAAHEPMAAETIELLERLWNETLARDWVQEALYERDRKHRFEVESSPYIGPFAEYLAPTFPDAQFILTVRSPRDWLRSAVDKCVNSPRSGLPQHYVRLRDLCFGPPPETYPEEEQPLASYHLHSLEGYLRYWDWHNRTVLNNIPANRLLVLQTKELSTSLSQLAAFLEVDRSELVDPGRKNASPNRHSVLDEVPEGYIKDLIEKHCVETVMMLQENWSMDNL
jgi:hypothetical protein